MNSSNQTCKRVHYSLSLLVEDQKTTAYTGAWTLYFPHFERIKMPTTVKHAEATEPTTSTKAYIWLGRLSFS
jgi:hypothetical protein